MRVLVTRLQERSAKLIERVEGLGLEAIALPLIEVEPTGDEPVPVDGYDWVVVTSPTGAAELARRIVGIPRHVAAIGPGTAEELRAQGIEPALVPERSTQEGLLEAFPRPAGRVLFAGAEDARRLLVDELGADFVPLYRTRPRNVAPGDVPEADVALLASASAARAFAALGIEVPAISIGPLTTEAARAAGLEVLAEAETHDLDGLVATLERVAARWPAGPGA